METTTAMQGVTVVVSYIGKGAPSNAAGRRTGYGRTKAEASEAAQHWANQAPWERFKKTTVVDLPESRRHTTQWNEQYEIACEITGASMDEFIPLTTAQKKSKELIERGLFATAILQAWK